MLIIAHKIMLYLQESKSYEFSSEGNNLLSVSLIYYMKWLMFPKVIRIIISFHDLFTANHCAVYLKLIQCVLRCSVISDSVTPWTTAPQASLSMEFSQARILEWVAISLSRGCSQPSGRTCASYVSCIERQFLYHWATLPWTYTVLYVSFISAKLEERRSKIFLM